MILVTVLLLSSSSLRFVATVATLTPRPLSRRPRAAPEPPSPYNATHGVAGRATPSTNAVFWPGTRPGASIAKPFSPTGATRLKLSAAGALIAYQQGINAKHAYDIMAGALEHGKS